MLVPEFQRRLPVTDPTKIVFRFQVVDDERLHAVLAEPSGVIQLPYQHLALLENDSQLAAVLSANIAEVMEKQAVRLRPAVMGISAAEMAGVASGFFVPGLGIATQIAGDRTAVAMVHRLEEQSTRTGLQWMEDAGFAVREAPVAWWRLADRKGKGLEKTALPYRSEYLYGVLWREGR